MQSVYRESPPPLDAHPHGESDGENPPALVPGMVTVMLDGNGRLLDLRPSRTMRRRRFQTPVSAEAVFRAAGWTWRHFREIGSVRWRLLTRSIRGATWRGPHPRHAENGFGWTWRGGRAGSRERSCIIRGWRRRQRHRRRHAFAATAGRALGIWKAPALLRGAAGAA